MELEQLEEILGHRFSDRELLRRALTHKSRVHERPADGPGSGDNEQLEFLGDAILGFVVSETLVKKHSTFQEGRLSKLKAHLVSAAHLYQVAQSIQLGDYLLLGRGEELSGGREKKALVSDALEALLAAMYLDGGIGPARAFIEKHVVGSFEVPKEGISSAVTDYKSALQETAQARKLAPPKYVIVGEDGPEHSKTFTVEVRLGRDLTSQAQGLSKKAAGQKAAQKLLQQLAEVAPSE